MGDGTPLLPRHQIHLPLAGGRGQTSTPWVSLWARRKVRKDLEAAGFIRPFAF